MTVKILFFSILRDLVGAENLYLELERDTLPLGEVITSLYSKYPDLELWDCKLLLAVNAEFADRSTLVRHGDELALMPPVQGG